MGLLLICPHCQTKIPLVSRACSACGADLRDLPQEQRSYCFGRPSEVAATPPIPAMVSGSGPEAVSAAESYPEAIASGSSLSEAKEVSLCEALDRILNKGAILFGEVMISVADIDLVYLGLRVILASMETARGFKSGLGEEQLAPNLSGKGI